MTSYEHAMLGLTGAMAAGTMRRGGWTLPALAAVAAVLPDWDSLTILFSADAFARWHRVLGHNLLVCCLTGVVLAVVENRLRPIARAGTWLQRRLAPRDASEIVQPPKASLFLGLAVAVLASLSHLAADVVFSGHATLSDWGVQLFWPFSDRAWAYPMVPWGDPVPAIIFAIGMFAMLRWPHRLERVAAVALAFVLAYAVLRGTILS